MIGGIASAAGSLVLLAVAVMSGIPFEVLVLVWLGARLARLGEAHHVR